MAEWPWALLHPVYSQKGSAELHHLYCVRKAAVSHVQMLMHFFPAWDTSVTLQSSITGKDQRCVLWPQGIASFCWPQPADHSCLCVLSPCTDIWNCICWITVQSHLQKQNFPTQKGGCWMPLFKQPCGYRIPARLCQHPTGQCKIPLLVLDWLLTMEQKLCF